MLNITERSEKDITIFIVEGRVDSEGAVDVDLALHTALEEEKYRLILEMANVRYINSSGLRTLADVLTQAQQEGGDLKLVNLNPKVQRVLEIIGFDKFFNIYDNVPDAVAAFQ